ncbi:MAG TPA: hypothetical protein VKG45_01005 [Actinomycetes bacterium]|nr:hypothetical protein [Actinomycetes bacterium]
MLIVLWGPAVAAAEELPAWDGRSPASPREATTAPRPSPEVVDRTRLPAYLELSREARQMLAGSSPTTEAQALASTVQQTGTADAPAQGAGGAPDPSGHRRPLPNEPLSHLLPPRDPEAEQERGRTQPTGDGEGRPGGSDPRSPATAPVTGSAREIPEPLTQLLAMAARAPAGERHAWLALALMAAVAEPEPLTPGRTVHLSPEQRSRLAQASLSPDDPGKTPSPDAVVTGQRIERTERTKPRADGPPPPLTRPFPRRYFGDDETDPDNWHEFTERVWRGEAPLLTWQSFLFTVLSTGIGFYGNVLREDLPYAIGNAPTVFARDIVGQVLIGRPTREDPFDNLMWNVSINAANVWLWEGIGYAGTVFLRPGNFDPIVSRWRERFVTPPRGEFGRLTIGVASAMLAGRERLDQLLAALRANSSNPVLRSYLESLASTMPTREQLSQRLLDLRIRFAAPPSWAVLRSLDVLAFLRGKQLHSGIPLQIIGINAGVQIMINLVKPELPLPQPIDIDDNGQPLYAKNAHYGLHKLYDAFLGIGLPTFIGSVFAATKQVGLMAKSKVALQIALLSAGYKLASDLATDRHSLAEFERIRFRPEPDVYELLWSDLANDAAWVAEAGWWLVRRAIPSFVYRAFNPLLQMNRYVALFEARWNARRNRTPLDLAEYEERKKELHWLLSKDAWDRAPTKQGDVWPDLVQLPTPETWDKIVVHHLANQADMTFQALRLVDQHIAKVVDLNQHDERPAVQIPKIRWRIHADADRMTADQKALYHMIFGTPDKRRRDAAPATNRTSGRAASRQPPPVVTASGNGTRAGNDSVQRRRLGEPGSSQQVGQKTLPTDVLRFLGFPPFVERAIRDQLNLGQRSPAPKVTPSRLPEGAEVTDGITLPRGSITLPVDGTILPADATTPTSPPPPPATPDFATTGGGRGSAPKGTTPPATSRGGVKRSDLPQEQPASDMRFRVTLLAPDSDRPGGVAVVLPDGTEATYVGESLDGPVYELADGRTALLRQDWTLVHTDGSIVGGDPPQPSGDDHDPNATTPAPAGRSSRATGTSPDPGQETAAPTSRETAAPTSQETAAPTSREAPGEQPLPAATADPGRAATLSTGNAADPSQVQATTPPDAERTSSLPDPTSGDDGGDTTSGGSVFSAFPDQAEPDAAVA